MDSSMTHSSKTPRKKVEVLTANYPISVNFDEHIKKNMVNKD
jgi:hypothetical protein